MQINKHADAESIWSEIAILTCFGWVFLFRHKTKPHFNFMKNFIAVCNPAVRSRLHQPRRNCSIYRWLLHFLHISSVCLRHSHISISTNVHITYLMGSFSARGYWFREFYNSRILATLCLSVLRFVWVRVCVCVCGGIVVIRYVHVKSLKRLIFIQISTEWLIGIAEIDFDGFCIQFEYQLLNNYRVNVNNCSIWHCHWFWGFSQDILPKDYSFGRITFESRWVELNINHNFLFIFR